LYFRGTISSRQIKMNTIVSKSLIRTAIFFLFVLPSGAQLPAVEIDRLVTEAMETFKVAGVGLGIVKDGEVFLAKGYGVRSVDTGKPMDPHTSFAIASNSKAFTSAALAILVEEGKLEWDDRVADHIPEFRMYNDYVTRNFNIVDLLTHRSGLPLGAGDLQIWPSGSDFSVDDMLQSFQYFEPVSAFRTKYDYDNILYLVAGELIRRTSGISYEEFVRSRILDPLQMKDSRALPPERTGISNVASPHRVVSDRLVTMEPFSFDPTLTNAAAAGLLSSTSDMCRWMLMHLNEGKYGEQLEKRLISEESQRMMWKIHTPIDARPTARYRNRISGYGLGWRLSEQAGQFTVSHTGDVSGMLSKTILLPDMELGVVVLTNSYYGGAALFRAVSQTIVDSYLGLDPVDWISHYAEREDLSTDVASDRINSVWETVESGAHGHIDVTDFEGTYEDPWFGKVEIGMKDGQLWFTSLRSPKLTGPMYHYRAETFAIRWENRELDADAFAIFCLDEEGRAQGMTMKGISPDIDFSFDFHHLDFIRTGPRDGSAIK